MDLIESIGWVAIGFVPTLISLYIGYNTGLEKSKRSEPMAEPLSK